MSSRQSQALEAIRKASDETGVDYQLMVSIATIESNLGANTVQHLKSGNRDYGLFQIMYKTWKGLQPGKAYSTDDYDQAIAAAKFLKQLIQSYGNNIGLIAIAYNKGTGVANFFKNGNEFNRENVRKIINKYWGNDENKVDELFNYPSKVTSIFNGNINELKREVNFAAKYSDYTAPEVQFSDFTYDKTKSFIVNLGRSKDSQRATSMALLAMVTNSNYNLLRERIRKSRLAQILKGR
jgi:hypothetical protein